VDALGSLPSSVVAWAAVPEGVALPAADAVDPVAVVVHDRVLERAHPGKPGAEFEGAVVGPPAGDRAAGSPVLGWGDELAGGTDEALEVVRNRLLAAKSRGGFR